MKRKLLWTSLLACLLLALLCCAAESGDFTIDENGVLTKYTGSDAVVTVPDGVTAIGKEAFYAKSAITEIHLPTGITSIGDSAFRSCAGLTEIVVPDSVETIGDKAFYDCSGLTSLRLSQGLKTLGANVFLSCDSLTEIEIPAGVESVGNYIASNTLRLRCAVGSSAAKALSKAQNDFWVEDFRLRYAFDSDGSAASLTLKKYAGDAASVTIPDGVTIVGDSVFNENTSLTAVVLPDSVVTIGANAFRSCTGLTAVTLSQNLNEIKTYAFGGCTGLTYIDIPAGLQKSQYIMGTSDERVQLRCAIGSDAAKALSEGGDSFCADDYQLRYSFDSDGQVTGLTVRKYLGSAAVVTLPEGTTEIGSEVFENHTEITEVVLPETLVTIGSYAFDGCTGLMRIVLPETLKTISFHAFVNCAALTEIVLPDGLTSLGSHAFYGCKKLTEMRVPDGILTLEVATFEYCANLTKVALPSKLEKIANYAFDNCKALKEIQIPETVAEIGSSAFQYCAGLTELTLPDGLQTIGESAFVGCSGLTRLAIPDGVQSVGSNAFHSTNAQLCCSMGSRAAEALSRVGYDFYTETWKLRYTFDSDKQVNGLRAERYLGSDAAVTLPEGTTLIGGSAFKDCAFITSVTLPEKLLSIGNYAFSGCTGLTEIVIPDSVTTIGSYAFSGCTGLTEIVIPDSVTTIGSYAFSGCTGLTRVVLPAGLTAIPDWCFNNCEKLPGIAIPETVTSIGSCAFRYCSALTAITLPQGLQTLGANAFLYCENLPYVDVPDTLESAGSYIASDTTQLRCSIGSSAAYTLSKNGTSFYDDGYKLRYTYADRDGSVTGLALNKYAGTEAEVRVPDGVTELIGWCCVGNNKVTSVALPESVVKIGEVAFYKCKNLSSVTLPQGIVEIGDSAFAECPKLTVIDIPDGLQKAAWLAEDDVRLRCSFGSSAAFALSKGGNNFCAGDFQMRYLFDDEGNRNGLRLNKYLGTDAEVTVPEEVTETGSAFKDCKTVTKVVLPAGLTKLESSIFSGCTALKEIAIPEGVTSIGNGAFRDCEALTELALPQGLKKIESYVFIGCTGLSYIDIPDGVETIDGHIVNEPTQLRCTLGSSAAIALSKSDNGFCVDGLRLRYRFDDDGNTNGLTVKRYLGSETEVTVPDGVDSIGDSAFYGCKGPTKLALPQGLKEIGGNAFLGCEGLSYIDIPDGVETVGDWIASESIQLRCSIGSSAAIALSKSDNGFCVDGLRLRYRFDDDGNTNGLTVKRYLGSETEVTVPDGVDSIGDSAFYGCKGPTKLALPQGLKEIGGNAFLGCEGLSYIDIPDGVETVGDWIASESIQLRCSIGSSAAIALSKAEQNFCVDDFAVRHSFTDGGAVNGLIAERYVGGKVGAVLTLPQGVTETSQYLLNEEPLENVMCLKLPEGFKKLTIDNLLWRSAVVFPESIQSIAIEEEWEGAPPVIFYCYRDTVAESFAQKRGITIVYLDGFKPAQTTVAMRSDYTLPIGSELRLSEIAAAVPSMPENCALNAVSSNPEVLQVESDGTIRVVGKGDATLRVSLSRYPDIYAEACVWGYVQPTSATLAEEIWIPAKATRDLLKKDLIILPADNRAPIGYGMDNWELFEQLEGEFTLMAVNRGDTALYVEVPGFDTLTAQIHVTARFSELAFEQTTITIPADTRATLCAQAVTTTHTYVNEYMTFESSAPDVATVDGDGVVYGVSEGSATITATSYNGLTAVCSVTVQGGNGSRLKLPAFLKEIGEEAFAGCSEESVIVPDGCETIGARAFADSANLRTITIPASVTSIAADAFDGCTDLTIRTPKGSYASRYAAAHGFGCVAE